MGSNGIVGSSLATAVIKTNLTMILDCRCSQEAALVVPAGSTKV
jgi:hypothetical protein